MSHPENAVDQRHQQLIEAAPIPVLWLLGKTASGKTSMIRCLTGATEAEIGSGFRPQTKYSRVYHFPDETAPIVHFLDTRGLGEAGYDPASDLARFDIDAHLIIVSVRAMDQAVDQVLRPLRQLRRSSSHRPVLLVLTCLHDGYPGKPHPEPDPFDVRELDKLPATVPEGLRRSIEAQLKRFDELVDRTVAIDLTPPGEGFSPPEFGGQRLKEAILEMLPAAYRQSLIQMDELNQSLSRALYHKVAPVILAHSFLAASAAAVPLPWADIPLVLGVQSRMAWKIARLNNQKPDSQTIASVTAAMGGRIAARMAVREALKFIPWVGSAVNAAATFALTYATGWAWNWYFMEVNKGHIPTAAELRAVYREQLRRGESFWKATLP